MDFREKSHVPNPRATANPISKLFFLWLVPLFRKGYKRDLTLDDMYDAYDEDRSESLANILEKAWDKEVFKAKEKGRRPKFYKAILSVFAPYYCFLSIFLMIDDWIIRIAQTLCLKWLVESFSVTYDVEDKELKQYLYATGVVLTTLLHALTVHPILFQFAHIGMKCRIASSALIYRKTLRLSKSIEGQTTVGQIANLLSNDVSRFDTGSIYIPYLIIGPIQLLILTYLLWKELGPSCLAGTGFILILIPVQLKFGTLSAEYRRKIAKITDERGRIMNEIIIAIRVIKMYAWEKPFSALIEKIRRLEVRILRRSAYLKAFSGSLYVSSAKVITFVTFTTYVLTDHVLTANKVFFAVAAYAITRQVMINFVPLAISGLAELIISMDRIETLLLFEEQEISQNLTVNKTLVNLASNDEGSEPRVQLMNATAHWTEEKVTLDKISVDLLGNKLVMVIGPVGSGKTSLLHALIAELPILTGKCIMNGKTSYATQEPWIFSGNLRQNIIFGQEFDQQKYDEIVQVCALEDDLKQLPHGDNTVVGERGVALSGGQKARVNLARALYKSADIYLLDDPLSAVDASVSRHIFEKCVKKYLEGHLRILVTHQLQYLHQADHIIVFNEGQILAQGSYVELIEQGVDFVSLLASEKEDNKSSRKESIVKINFDVRENEVAAAKPKDQKETMASGSINWKVYWEYIRSGDSYCDIFWLFLAFAISPVLFACLDYWLSDWTNDEERKNRENTEEDGTFSQDVYIWVYARLTLVIFVAMTLRAIYFFRYCMKISINVHNRMFGSIVRAPTKFFDDNPSGRIMNRFTKDLGSMDELLPSAFYDTLAIFLLMFGMIIVVVISNWYMSIAAAILVIVLGLMGRYFIRTSRHVKRLESVARSPVLTHMTASMQGLTTIRASGSQETLISQFDGYQNIHSSCFYIFLAANRGFAIWLDMAAVLFLTAVTYSFLILSSDALGGNVGLAISSALGLTGAFQFGMRQSAETENLMTSVERALEYAQVEHEAALESTSDKTPPKDWPARGHIEFQNVFLAYEDKDVLKSLSFDMKSKEKIGIVGRTGAGKSSIVAALFRMTQPRGKVLIDSIDVNEIGLHDLRRNISIIPQDPVLFSGTVRYNLDPFEQFEDDKLWKVLEEVELKEAVPALDFKVADGGNNFSVGQRQLVCLARAILRQNRIIVMDEATANVDPRTDSFIQKTIRSTFVDCTIITIAHRLHSVMDCDRILVLENGFLKEYDHPHVLLQNPNGILTSMVRHTGNASGAQLMQVAADTFSGRRGSFRADNVNLLTRIKHDDIENQDEDVENEEHPKRE